MKRVGYAITAIVILVLDMFVAETDMAEGAPGRAPRPRREPGWHDDTRDRWGGKRGSFSLTTTRAKLSPIEFEPLTIDLLRNAIESGPLGAVVSVSRALRTDIVPFIRPQTGSISGAFLPKRPPEWPP